MKFLLSMVLTVYCLFGSSSTILGAQTTEESLKVISLKSILSVLSVPSSPSESAIEELIQIGSINHVPMGIVLGDDPSLCRGRLSLGASAIELGSLLSLVNQDVTGYHAELVDGVVNIIPVKIPSQTAAYLNLNIPRFHSEPETITDLGTRLWVIIRSIIVPTEGTAFGGLGSATAMSVHGIDASNKSSKALLNTFVSMGGRGIWIWNDLALDAVSATKVKPYEVYDYVGDSVLLKNATPCSHAR